MDAIEHSWRPSIRQGVLAVRSLDRRSSIRARHWYACTRQWRRIRGVQGSTPEQTSFKRSLALRETTRIQTMFWAVALAGIWFCSCPELRAAAGAREGRAAMRDDVRREFEKRIRGLPNERIEAEMEEWAYDSEERSIV